MSGLMKDAESALGGGGQSGNQQSGGMGGGMNDNSQGGMGNDSSNTGGAQQGGGGGFMKNVEGQGKDTMVNQEVNQFMSKEGIPQGADNTVDKALDTEVNKYA